MIPAAGSARISGCTGFGKRFLTEDLCMDRIDEI